MPAAIFPVPNWTHAGYHHNAVGGARYFGAPRDGGRRLHAACDLYAPILSPILAIADGVVKQNPYYFYCDTNALEVIHTGYDGYVFRYGEINRHKTVPHVRAGTKVKAGDVIAYIGRLSGLSVSMLHLEMYSPQASDHHVQLTVRSGGRFQRSRYLIDPTAHIDAWLNKRPAILAPSHDASAPASHHDLHDTLPPEAHASHDTEPPPSDHTTPHSDPASLRAPPTPHVSPLQLAPVRMYCFFRA